MNLLRAWFVRHHGEGAANQFDVYRCDQCRSIVTHKMIRRGGCRCAGARMRPTNPTMLETFRLLVLPWTM